MTSLTELSTRHLVLIPSYNTGPLLVITVEEILQYNVPVWVVIDGSDDGSVQLLEPLKTHYSDALIIKVLAKNSGKGAAILVGITAAKDQGFTHVLTMDADHQHSADCVPRFIALSEKNPETLILGKPIFDESAPMIRVKGRCISNWWANLETLGKGIEDSLFGMRLYPINDLMAVMHETRWARRFDFEPEVVVRMAWRGVPLLNIATPVRYIAKEAGGVTQFKYGRDNILLIGMHIRLFAGFLMRLAKLIIIEKK